MRINVRGKARNLIISLASKQYGPLVFSTTGATRGEIDPKRAAVQLEGDVVLQS